MTACEACLEAARPACKQCNPTRATEQYDAMEAAGKLPASVKCSGATDNGCPIGKVKP